MERKARAIWLQERRFGGTYKVVTGPGESYTLKPQVPVIVPEYVAQQLEVTNAKLGRTKFLVEWLTPAGVPELQGVPLVPEVRGNTARPARTEEKKRPKQLLVADLLKKKAA